MTEAFPSYSHREQGNETRSGFHVCGINRVAPTRPGKTKSSVHHLRIERAFPDAAAVD